MKIKILKPTLGKNIGDIIDVNFPGEDEQEYIDNGFIEKIDEIVKVGDKKNKRINKEKKSLPLNQINEELKKIKLFTPLEQDELLKKLAENSGKRITRLREQMRQLNEIELKIKKPTIEDNPTPTGILKEQANEQEIEKYKHGVNWVDDDYLANSWKRLKAKTHAQVKQSDFLFQLFSSKGSITGKPQIRDNDVKTNITLLVKAVKNDKDGVLIESYKFVDDPYNRRDDGYEEDVLEEDYWIYDVIDNGIKHIVLCRDKLENHEVHTFFGTGVKINHSKEFDKNLTCRGSANLFFCNNAESTIKPLPENEIIPYVKNFFKQTKMKEETFKEMMFEYIFFHPNGIIYNQPKDYMLLRHAQLLSGKEEGYPLHFFLWGGFGVGKTQEIECMDNIFKESILEAANSTPKSLVPSFSEKIPNPGFILNSNRVALIDEMMKMVDNAMNNTRNSTEFKNQLSNLNFILEHRSRRANSGNGNLFCKPTAKMIVTTNPSMKSKYIHEELSVMDPSTFSRCLCYVKGESHVEFIEKNELRNCANTYPLYCNKGETNEKNISHNLRVFAQNLRDFYVTIYDSCQCFRVIYNEGLIKNIFQSCVNLAKNPMKTMWKRRGMHHTKLILDGIVKYRCIFQDFDDSFEAKQIDYDNTERILVGMIKNWDFDMTISKEELWTNL